MCVGWLSGRRRGGRGKQIPINLLCFMIGSFHKFFPTCLACIHSLLDMSITQTSVSLTKCLRLNCTTSFSFLPLINNFSPNLRKRLIVLGCILAAWPLSTVLQTLHNKQQNNSNLKESLNLCQLSDYSCFYFYSSLTSRTRSIHYTREIYNNCLKTNLFPWFVSVALNLKHCFHSRFEYSQQPYWRKNLWSKFFVLWRIFLWLPTRSSI